MTIARTSVNKDLLGLDDQKPNPSLGTEATEFERQRQEKENSVYDPEYDHVAFSNVYAIEGINEDISINGVSPALANELLMQDIKKAEDAVKNLLRSAGLETVPIEVFDALTSFQYHIGDASYIYYDGRKLSMLPWLRKRRWDRVADYLAADERDRAKRIKEASIIYHLDYMTTTTEEQRIAKGFEKSIEEANKDPNYPPEKRAALERAYFNYYGYPIEGSTSAEKSKLEDDSGQKKLKARSGPWTY